MNQLVKNTTPQFTIAIENQASIDDTINVDHVRFSPERYNFEATVYDKKKRPTASIDARVISR